jgi:hypothetical protein
MNDVRTVALHWNRELVQSDVKFPKEQFSVSYHIRPIITDFETHIQSERFGAYASGTSRKCCDHRWIVLKYFWSKYRELLHFPD